ncbi:uncharacterized protein LOC132316526 [Cornus florida]|uniref:uncharacterized protein LOC132316526 n=1 Tax=Cornus florida TaxID=4283 RepID=UPI002899EF59|nr:uncharacterized protein LOC132316526 [Cornus florida]
MDQSAQLLDEDNVAEDQSSQILWSEKNEEILITLMEEERKNGNQKGTTFSIEGWKNLEEGMLRLTKEKYTNLQLRNKFNRLRDRYKTYKKFLSNPGSSWDPVTGQVTLTDAQWEEMEKQVRHAKRLQKKGCKHYDLLSNLFGDTYATGNHAHPSNRSPCISSDEGDKNPNEINEVVDTSRHMSRSADLARTRLTKESFQKTISSVMSGYDEYFMKKAEALDKGGSSSGKSIICPPNMNKVPLEIQHNEKYFPFFQNCIGAIDGTHIHANVPASSQIPYRGRKSDTTQNVIVICSFDMKFTYVVAGWEGSANDSRVLLETIFDPTMNFSLPPKGKYYLVDSGYTNMRYFLAPYRGERYHLQEYRGRRIRGPHELFNYRHSSLRNVIERCFAHLDHLFDEYGDENANLQEEEEEKVELGGTSQRVNVTHELIQEISETRDAVANEL